MAENLSLEKTYKDHTVPNPVDDLRLEALPGNAFSVHSQPIRLLTVTIQVLDTETETVLETITGKAESGTIRVDGNSLVRRSASIRMMVDPDLFPQQGSLMWFDKTIKVYVGLDDTSKHDYTVNFLVGTFWVGDGLYNINSEESRLSFELEDKMMQYEDTELENSLVIDVGTPIHVAMRMMMEHVGETKFGEMVESRDGEVVPYTLEYKIGDKVMDVVKSLRDMYMDYICGYDVQGRFEFRRIESQREQDLPESKWRFDAEDSTLRTLLSFQESYNLKSIKNRVIVYGGTSDITGLTPMGETRITDVKSPFNIYAIGKRTKIITEPKYVTDEQCIAKAKYEVWKSSNFQEISTISTIPIYFLDAHDVIDVVHPFTKKEHKYMIDSLDFSLGTESTMNIQAHKVYYVTLEYGEESIPLVDAIIRGISNYGWISLGEEIIYQGFNIMGAGDAALNITFQDNIPGGEQMSVTSYPTSRNQGFNIDIADFKDLDFNSQHGGYIEGSSRSKADYMDRVITHEMFHAVSNDYFGHNKMIQAPVAWKESWAEMAHGAKERYLSVYTGMSNADKKTALVDRAMPLLENNFDGTSEDYVTSYLIAIACYRLAKRRGIWYNLFINLKKQENFAINFWLKFLPIAETNDEVKNMIVAEMQSMNDVYAFLNDVNDVDTGSILGIHFENKYGVPLTAENVVNNNNATIDSIGFKLEFIK